MTRNTKEQESFIHLRQGWVFWTLEPKPLIYNLFVIHEHRGKGWASVLIDMAKAEIQRTNGQCEIHVQAKPRGKLLDVNRLIKFYKSKGLVVNE